MLYCSFAEEGVGAIGRFMKFFAFILKLFNFLAIDGTCEPPSWIVALVIVAALFVVGFCCCSGFCCWRRVARVRRGLLEEY